MKIDTSGGVVTAVMADCGTNCVKNRPRNGVRFTVFGKLARRTRWMSGTALHKSGRCRDKSRSDNHTQTSRNLRYIPNQIHGMKHISIKCNMIEHWVHLRCACIRLAHYTDTWTGHLHKISRLTTHSYNITQPFQTLVQVHSLTTPHTSPQSKQTTSNTLHIPTGLVKPKPNPLIRSPLSPPISPRAKHTHFTHSTYSFHPTHHTQP